MAKVFQKNEKSTDTVDNSMILIIYKVQCVFCTNYMFLIIPV